MPITRDNTVDIVYKKLAGKLHTNTGLLPSQETNGFFPQVDVTKIFGQKIPETVQQAIEEQLAEEITCYIKGEDSSNYKEESEVSPGKHAYSLYLDEQFTTPFVGDVIPDSFGADYKAQLYDIEGDPVDSLSSHNWVFDYSSKIVWFQNIEAEPIPEDGWTIKIYKYIGQSMESRLGAGGGSGGESIGIYKPAYENYDSVQSEFSLLGDKNYYLLYGHDQTAEKGTGTTIGDDHQATLFNLNAGSINTPRQIVVKNIGLPIDHTIQNPEDETQQIPYTGPLTVAIKVADDVRLNGEVGKQHNLYVVGETVTMLWDGEEWHIV